MASPSSHKPRRKPKKTTEFDNNTKNKTEALIRTPSFPLAAFLWPARSSLSQWEVLPLILMVVGLRGSLSKGPGQRCRGARRPESRVSGQARPLRRPLEDPLYCRHPVRLDGDPLRAPLAEADRTRVPHTRREDPGSGKPGRFGQRARRACCLGKISPTNSGQAVG